MNIKEKTIEETIQSLPWLPFMALAKSANTPYEYARHELDNATRTMLTTAREGGFHYRYVPAIQEALKSYPQHPTLIQYARSLFDMAKELGYTLRDNETSWFDEHVNLTVA